MTSRVLFVGEGTSDNGLVIHIEQISLSLDVDVEVAAPDFDRLAKCGHAVDDKLRAVQAAGGAYDLVAVHRDANGVGAEQRREEIAAAMAACMPSVPWIAIVPVRMTEAWLLLDEAAVRRVAGNPAGRVRLDSARDVERLSDPKADLKWALATAAECQGRKLRIFQSRFGQHRRQLLERLDPAGPVSGIESWNRFVGDVESALRVL